ncbi:MAG: translation initiation factor IF-2 subunit gamma [Thermoplasmata archaeon]
MKVHVQPELNVGIVGHVDHGKTTLTYALTGERTDRLSEERKRGITIRLGYADAEFYQCPKCEGIEGYTNSPTCPKCGSQTNFLRSVSFVDAPGHESLMATVLSGAAIMDGALLIISADEKCPQPQTKEHLLALQIANVKNVVVAQTKIDLVSRERAKESYNEIRNFLKGTFAENAPIIPVSAHHGINIEALIFAIQKYIPTPKFDGSKPPRMYIARSFDVNMPGTQPEKLVGGVVGGTIMQGKLSIGDEVEIAPGNLEIVENQKVYNNIVSRVTSLYAGVLPLNEAKPGGLIAVGTMLDPSLTRSDSLSGKMLGKPGTLPEMRQKLVIEVHLLDRVVGVASELKVEKLKTSETLMLNIGTAKTSALITSTREDIVEANLKVPVCCEAGDRVAVSRKVGTTWRLIGYGIIK